MSAPLPTPRIALRRATANDLDAVVAIERRSFTDPTWSRDTFHGLLAAAHMRFLVACDAGASDPTPAVGRERGEGEGEGEPKEPSAILGYIVLAHVVDEAEIANLAVAPEWRGRGVGAYLVDAAVATAAKAGVRVLYLEVRESNAGAQRLYRSRGFVEVGRRHRYYRNPVEDALLFERRM
jgi:ribosomal-protein-alanine N-acetyltransferase